MPGLVRADVVQELVDAGGALLALEGQGTAQRPPLLVAEAGRTLRTQTAVTRLGRRQAVERMTPGQELVGDAAERIDIVARIGLAVFQHLRAGIGRRQRAQAAGIEDRDVGRFFRLLEHACDAEIDHLDAAAVRQDHVGRLEVAMHEAALVRISQGLAHAAHDLHRFLEGQGAKVRRAQQLAQRFAGQVFHGHVDHRTVAVEVVHRHDVGVGQGLRLARFALQGDQRLRMPLELHVQHLDRDIRMAVGSLQLAQVERFINGAHAAEADAFLQHEAAVERVADAFHALGRRFGSGVRAGTAAGPGAGLGRLHGLGLDKGFLVAQALACLDRARDAALDLAVDLGRQRRTAVRLVERFKQVRHALRRADQQAVDACKHLGLPKGAALEQAKGVGEAFHVNPLTVASAANSPQMHGVVSGQTVA